MDSTILNRIGRRLEPDDRIKDGSTALKELLESKEIKKIIKEKSKTTLEKIQKENIYYKKYRGLNINKAKKPLEELLQLKEQPINNSSIIQERKTRLEFEFKKLNIRKRR
ncbi:hypothetical protein NEAUS04_2595 [Nematocida ausubeli]|nr:hypothetical protein NEAUS06_2399 [Nematocida ausubeli]KAI5139076.1 hypothetical protein NEAUS07_2595 [Nematocida ausubeli]KAI5151806.1 hypothetical protein NEAUS05_2598 [Nematocida ausubeli]KAI5166692.1 hypothetical protein NEAUS04_2595 [Nematocida ausubeli]